MKPKGHNNSITIEVFDERFYDEYRSWYLNEETQKYLGFVDKEWLDHILNDTTGEELVALEDDKLLGVVGITFPVKENPTYVITNIAVSPEKRGCGIGKQIIIKVIHRYRLQEGEYWKTFIDPSNIGAINFFEKLGWKEEDIYDNMILFTLFNK